jgi:hypothetical protein
MSNLVTPRKLAERIIRLASKGNQPNDSQIDEREVIDIIIDKSNAIAKREFLLARNEGIRVPDTHYIYTYRGIPVQVMDDFAKTNFVQIPTKYASLPYGAGVQVIWPETENEEINDDEFIPIMPGYEQVYKEIIKNSVQKQFAYMVEGDKAFFRKRCGETLCDRDILYVKMRIVVILGDLLPDDPLQVPPEFHDEIVTETLRLLAGSYEIPAVKDKTTDNNPDIVAK